MKTIFLIAGFLVVVLAVSYANAAECRQGETKQIDCNTCFCANGNWACTLKGCLRKRAIPARFEGEYRFKREEFSCIPGQTFAKECNTCVCTPDGKNAICTLKSCKTNQI